MLTEETKRIALALQKELADQGKLVEGGWAAFAHICFNESTPQEQRVEMRKAFFAGAMHLFQSIMGVMDADREPTEHDMIIMSKINDELEGWAFTQQMFEALFKRKQH